MRGTAVQCWLWNQPLQGHPREALALGMAGERRWGSQHGSPGIRPYPARRAWQGENFCSPTFLSPGRQWRHLESWGQTRMPSGGCFPCPLPTPFIPLPPAPCSVCSPAELNQSSLCSGPASAANANSAHWGCRPQCLLWIQAPVLPQPC